MAFQMAGTTNCWLLANSSNKADISRTRNDSVVGRGRTSFSIVRSTKPAATNSLSCSVTAVRVTPSLSHQFSYSTSGATYS